MLFPNLLTAAVVLSSLATGLPLGDRRNGIEIMDIARRNAEPYNPFKALIKMVKQKSAKVHPARLSDPVAPRPAVPGRRVFNN
ncbi:hypothetical protein HYFRA_00013092 [Hymenoscyphus fraxineus]|uniref:Uncharacterized protein n=1 Tax=Hymenoscyphus fraxineus TaxID=746836 RepID=A0A9N9L9B2_9HELO|nr:hypothetical protein HYFRA_00013092 [Hymenoscyphus fraxineus]